MFFERYHSGETVTVVRHAAGGYGKSHFLKTTASLLDKRRKFQIFFIRPFLRNLETLSR